MGGDQELRGQQGTAQVTAVDRLVPKEQSTQKRLLGPCPRHDLSIKVTIKGNLQEVFVTDLGSTAVTRRDEECEDALTLVVVQDPEILGNGIVLIPDGPVELEIAEVQAPGFVEGVHPFPCMPIRIPTLQLFGGDRIVPQIRDGARREERTLSGE